MDLDYKRQESENRLFSNLSSNNVSEADISQSVINANYGQQENLGFWDSDDEEHKTMMFLNIIQATKDNDTKKVEEILINSRNKIDHALQNVFINYIALHKHKDAYLKVKEFFEENANNRSGKTISESQEMPETYDDMMNDPSERQKIRENAWKVSLKLKAKTILFHLIEVDGSNIIIDTQQFADLYEIDIELWHKVITFTNFSVLSKKKEFEVIQAIGN